MVMGVEVRRPDASRNDPLDLRAPLVADRGRLIALELAHEVMGPAEIAIALGDPGATPDRLGQRLPSVRSRWTPTAPAAAGLWAAATASSKPGMLADAGGADQALVERLKNAGGRGSIETEIIGHDHRRGVQPFRSDPVRLCQVTPIVIGPLQDLERQRSPHPELLDLFAFTLPPRG